MGSDVSHQCRRAQSPGAVVVLKELVVSIRCPKHIKMIDQTFETQSAGGQTADLLIYPQQAFLSRRQLVWSINHLWQ